MVMRTCDKSTRFLRPTCRILHRTLRKPSFAGVGALFAVIVPGWACTDSGMGPGSRGSNSPPVATAAIPAQTVFVGHTVTLSLSQYFSDPDGDALTYVAEAADAHVAAVSVSGSSVTVAGQSQGTTTVTVTASDAGGLTVQQTFGTTVPNRAPTAVDSIADLDLFIGDTIEIDVSAYFSDPDGDTLTYTAETAHADLATASVHGSSAIVTGLSQGTTTVTVTATDASGLAASQTFAVEVPNRAPQTVATIPDLALFTEDSIRVDVSGYFSDPDGDALTYAAVTADANVATVSVVWSTVTVVGVSQGATTITVTASDAGGLTAQETLGVEVPNRAPVTVGSVADLDLYAGDTVEVDVSGNFDDPDGDMLSYDAASSDQHVATVTAQGATITVFALSDGTASLTVTASDPGGLTAQQGFSANLDTPADPSIRLLTGPVAVLEGETIVVEVQARPAPSEAIEVPYTIGGDGDPQTDDADESDHDGGSGGVIRFPAGSRSATVAITVLDDDEVDPTREVLAVQLDAPEEGAGYELGSPTAVLATIQEGVCDRTPRVRDDLMALTGVNRCQQVDRSVLAAIEILDLRGHRSNPPESGPDMHGLDGVPGRLCGHGRSSASHRRKVSHPVAKFARCKLTGHVGMTPLPSPPRAGTGSGRPLQQLRAGDFMELDELRQLWLSDNVLTELPQDIFSGLAELRHLNLDRNRLAGLPEGLLTGLARLEVVAVAGNQLTRVHPDLFSGLSRLKGVWLNRNELDELPARLFRNLGNLEGVHLWENRLDSLPEGIFAGLGNLGTLALGNNRLAQLDPGVFSGLGGLEHLDLVRNQLTELPPDVFSNLGNLKLLVLGENRLADLSPDVFADIGGIEVLHLHGNRLQHLPEGLFSGLAGLEGLYLSENRLELLEPGIFSSLSGLEVLWLADNRIASLAPGTFDGLGILQTLVLDGNSFSELESDVFRGLSHLNDLWLGYGKLRVVHPGAFNGLSRLRELYLYQNQLAALESGTFAGLSSLVELWLYRNRISELSADVFSELPLLKRLVVWGNVLAELPPGVFSALEGLEELYLSDNQVTTVPSGVFSNLMALKVLSMHQNELAELPNGVFAGLSELLSLNLDHNPGAPFTLDVRMVRTDTADLAAPGPATVVLAVAEGAPFRMKIPLVIEGGSLSAAMPVIEKGQIESAEFTVTMSPGSQNGTRIFAGPTPPVPDSIVGVNLVAADTLVLFTTSSDVSGSVPGTATVPSEATEMEGFAPGMPSRALARVGGPGRRGRSRPRSLRASITRPILHFVL